MAGDEPWSDWLNFDQGTIDAVPEKPGVFVMHASMKILYIGGASNMRAGLQKALADDCAKDASRFKYMEAEDYDAVRGSLLQDYKERHDGSMPRCM